MGSRVADVLARMRTCHDAGLPVPADLLEEMIEIAERLLSARERKQLRDRELRLAALLLPANDAAWAKAGRLMQEARAMTRTKRAVVADPIRACLRQAARLKELPRCQKQFARILAANDDE